MEVEFKPSTEPGCAGFFPRSVAFISERGPGAIDEYDGKVVECQFTPETGCWEVTRVRVDKTHPNSAVTAGSIAGCAGTMVGAAARAGMLVAAAAAALCCAAACSTAADGSELLEPHCGDGALL